MLDSEIQMIRGFNNSRRDFNRDNNSVIERSSSDFSRTSASHENGGFGSHFSQIRQKRGLTIPHTYKLDNPAYVILSGTNKGSQMLQGYLVDKSNGYYPSPLAEKFKARENPEDDNDEDDENEEEFYQEDELIRNDNGKNKTVKRNFNPQIVARLIIEHQFNTECKRYFRQIHEDLADALFELFPGVGVAQYWYTASYVDDNKKSISARGLLYRKYKENTELMARINFLDVRISQTEKDAEAAQIISQLGEFEEIDASFEGKWCTVFPDLLKSFAKNTLEDIFYRLPLLCTKRGLELVSYLRRNCYMVRPGYAWLDSHTY